MGGIDAATHRVYSANDYRVDIWRQARTTLLAAFLLSLTAIVLLLKFPPSWVSLLLCLGIAPVTWHRPALGIASVLGITLLVEQYNFGVNVFRPITALVPLFDNASRITGVRGFEASPLEILLFAVAVVVLTRAVTRHAQVRKNPLTVPVLAFLIALSASLVLGLARGGAFTIALWEVRGLVYFCLLVFVVPQTVATRRDVRMIMWVAIVVIGVKAAQGVWNYAIVLKGDVGLVGSVTGHEDALFIAWMFVLLVGLLVYRAARRQRLALLATAPLMAFAFVATERRAAYAALALGLVVLAALVASDVSKRRLLVKVGVPALVIFVLMAGVGWSSSGALGAPARVIKSIVAPQSVEDVESNYYRQVENENLMDAIKTQPVFGLGFGRPFQRPGQRGIVDVGFSLENYIAHNEIMWIWAKMGTLGFALFWVMMGGFIAFGGVVFRTVRQPYSKVLAALVTCAVAMQIVVSSVDLQLTYARNMVFLGVLVGILARLPALDEEEPSDGPA